VFCLHCGKEIPDHSRFCLSCGKSLAPPSKEQTHKSSRGPLYLIGIAILAVLLAILFNVNSGGPGHGFNSEATYQTVSQPLLSGQIVVGPLQYYSVHLTIDRTVMRDPRVVGNFRASGGTGNDVQVALGEDNEFANWINGHPGRMLYATPQTTTGSLLVPMRQSGNYTFVISNKASLISSKNVFGDVKLLFEKKSESGSQP
jgi:hypothetical protein